MKTAITNSVDESYKHIKKKKPALKNIWFHLHEVSKKAEIKL